MEFSVTDSFTGNTSYFHAGEADTFGVVRERVNRWLAWRDAGDIRLVLDGVEVGGDDDMLVRDSRVEEGSLLQAEPSGRRYIAQMKAGVPLHLAQMPPWARADPDIVRAAVCHVGEDEFAHASTELRSCKRLIRELLGSGVYPYIHQSLFDDKALAMRAVMAQGCALEFVDPALQDDKEVVMASMQAGGLLKYASPRLRDDSDVISAALHHSSCLRFKQTLPCTDRLLVIKSLTWWGEGLHLASNEVKDDPNVIRAGMNHRQRTSIFCYASKRLRHDLHFVMGLMKRHRDVLYAAPQRRSASQMKTILRTYPDALQYAHEELRSSPTFMMWAVQHQVPDALLYAEPELLSNHDFMMECSRIQLLALRFISNSLRIDPVFQLAVFREHNGFAKWLGYKRMTYLTDRDVVLEAGGLGVPFSFVHESLRGDPEIVRIFVTKDATALGSADTSLLWDVEFMCSIVHESPDAFEYVPDMFRDDESYTLACIKSCRTRSARARILELSSLQGDTRASAAAVVAQGAPDIDSATAMSGALLYLWTSLCVVA